MADISDLVKFTIEKNPVDFESTLNDMLSQRAIDAIDSLRIDVAKQIYGDTVDDTIDDSLLNDDDFDNIDDSDLDNWADDELDPDLSLDDIDDEIDLEGIVSDEDD